MLFKKEIVNIHTQLRCYEERGLSLFTSSSFQTHSIPLLHILSQYKTKIPVYFLNTGFHFPETIQFKNEVAERLHLQVIDLESPVSKFSQRDPQGRFYFASKPDYCCYLNKVLPMEPILKSKDVWIAGVRADQNTNRAAMSSEIKGKHNTLRYHPILNWTQKKIHDYRKYFDLPPHPLEAKGYLSIGCEPCTQSFLEQQESDARNGRWAGMKKSECGLHVELVESEVEVEEKVEVEGEDEGNQEKI